MVGPTGLTRDSIYGFPARWAQFYPYLLQYFQVVGLATALICKGLRCILRCGTCFA